MERLTPKKALFCKEYIVDFNATKAAKRAGYGIKGASAAGLKCLSSYIVQQEIRLLMQQRSSRLDSSADKVVKELSKVAYQSADDVAAWGPSGVVLKDSESLSPEVLATIDTIEETAHPNGTVNVKVQRSSKLGALKLLAQHHGVIGKVQIEHTVVPTFTMPPRPSSAGGGDE